MNRIFARSFWLVLLASLTLSAAGHAQGSSISVSYFYDGLSPYGEWFQDPTYGWCWTPNDVAADWRPYSEGHWVYTDYGWSWASDEEWGWAPYHYGRWFFDDQYGWAWVPGTEWAPAWVAWRYDDDYVGWAALPPSARWSGSAGLAFGNPDAIPSHEWCFVPRRHVFDGSLRLQVASVGRNVTLLQRSHNATRFEVRGGRPANVGPDIAQIEHTLGRRVPRERIVDLATPARGGGRPAGAGGVGFYRPAVRPSPAGRAPAPPMNDRRAAVSPQAAQRLHEGQQRKLESDLAAERARLAREQADELRAQKPGPGVQEARKRQASEQQAFDSHAAQQRKVMQQRQQRLPARPQNAPQNSPQRAPQRAPQHAPQRAPQRAPQKPQPHGPDKGHGKDNGRDKDHGGHGD